MYTCPMHPEIERAESGRCPKCGMQLVLKSETKKSTPMHDERGLVIGLVALILGLGIGYFAGAGTNDTSKAPVASHQMPDGSMMKGTDMGTAMSGMMMGLEGKTGDALDEVFLDEMIVHHQGAIEMAQMLLQGTKRPELIKLGNDIITAQTGEIEMMKQWRENWFGR